MGLAPLLGFLFDALVGGTKLDDVIEDWIRRSVPRVEFLMRNAFGGPSTLAGWGLALWIGAIAVTVSWMLSLLGYVVYEEFGLFAVRAAIFTLLFTARRLTARGIEALVLVSSGQFGQARAALRRLGPTTHADDMDALCGATVERLSGATLGALLIPLFWGLIGGSTLATGALAVHLVALQRPDGEESATPMWHVVTRIDRWIAIPAAWIGGLVYPLVVHLVGGRRTTALAAFVGSSGEPPASRLGHAISRGFGLQTRDGDGAVIASGEAVQKVVQTLFLGGFVCAIVTAVVGVGLHHVM